MEIVLNRRIFQIVITFLSLNRNIRTVYSKKKKIIYMEDPVVETAIILIRSVDMVLYHNNVMKFILYSRPWLIFFFFLIQIIGFIYRSSNKKKKG